MEPTVDHNPEMNKTLRTTIAAHFPGVLCNLILEGDLECVELVGIEGEEGKKYPPSCKHTLHMDSEYNWVILNQEMNCVANHGDCLESLIICLKQFKYLWASLTPPESDDGYDDQDYDPDE